MRFSFTKIAMLLACTLLFTQLGSVGNYAQQPQRKTRQQIEEERAQAEKKASQEKFIAEMKQAIRKQASDKVREIFKSYFLEYDGQWVTKGKARISQHIPYGSLPINSYWLAFYKEVDGFEVDDWGKFRKFEGVDKSNYPEVEQEAVFNIKAAQVRRVHYEALDKPADGEVEKYQSILDYGKKVPTKWEHGFSILRIVLWKYPGGWVVKENGITYGSTTFDVPNIDREKGELIKPTLEEVQAELPAEGKKYLEAVNRDKEAARIKREATNRSEEPRRPRDGYAQQRMTDEELKKTNEEIKVVGDKFTAKIFNRPSVNSIDAKKNELAKVGKEYALKHIIGKSVSCEPSNLSNNANRTNQALYTFIHVNNNSYLLEISSFDRLEAAVSNEIFDSNGAIKSASVAVSAPNSYIIYGIPRHLLLGSDTLFTIRLDYPWAQRFEPKIEWSKPASKLLSNTQISKPLSCVHVQRFVNSSSKK